MRYTSITYSLFAVAILLLAIASGIVLFSDGQVQNEEVFVSSIQKNIRNELDRIQRESVDVLDYLENSDEVLFYNLQSDAKYPIYIFNDGRLVYWSDYHYVPEYRYIRGNYKEKFIRTLRKDFLAKRWKISNSSLEVFSILPLYDNYKIDNVYVRSGYNPDIFPDQSLTIHQLSDDTGNSICLDDCLFNVSFGSQYVEHRNFLNASVATLFGCAILLLLFGAYLLANNTARKGAVLKGVLTFLILFIAVRWLMLFFQFPISLVDVNLFDSRFYASSAISPSFGDLFMNVLGIVVLYLLLQRYYSRVALYKWLRALSKLQRLVLGAITGAFLIMLFHFLYLFFQTVYHNSQITYDISETISFDAIRVMAFLFFIMLSFVIFSVHHTCYNWLNRMRGPRFWMMYGFGALLFVGVNLIFRQSFIVPLIISAGYVLLLRLTSLSNSLAKIRYRTFLYGFSSVIATALVATFSIYEFEVERENDLKFKFANQFLIENDHLAEFLLSEINEKIKEDVFIQGRLSSPFLTKEIIKSKIRQVYLSNYFDKYDLDIYLYNANGEPLESQVLINPDDMKELNAADYQTKYPEIFFINKLGGDVSKRYLDFIEVKKRGITVGYIILDLKLKRIIPENVYPELLVDNRFLFPYQDVGYSYAVFDSTRILYQSGNFNYYTDFRTDRLVDEQLYRQGIKSGNYTHVAVRDNEGRVVVISSNEQLFSGLISNFSFLFLVQVFTGLVIVLLFVLYFSFKEVTLNYSARIQLYLNVAFFLPLFAVSITTLSLINSSFRKEVNQEYYSKAQNIAGNISDDLSSYLVNLLNDRDDLSTKLSEVAKYSGVDVNLFNVSGKLIATSQNLIYENNLISSYINPEALISIREFGENAFVTNERVGQLQFNTTYYTIKSFETGNLIGILSIPFFQSAHALEQNQIEVLTNVINIFTFIFIILLLLSYFAAKWLTFPLTFITQKLKKTTLTGFNEPMTWDTDDEIGLMVGEYNRMLIKLEESKKALARSEKESAWREIAQQVAHEIKNPLTPMKLTLQHLSRKLMGTKNHDMDKPINSLLHQVDTLSDIASSFSSFAKMPIPENERFDLISVIRKVVKLHEVTENVELSLELPSIEELYTIGDEQLMSRILSNIILNASQSKHGQLVHIDFTLTPLPSGKIVLEIADNGDGIDEEIRGKVFMPNFSTKETGSGIGLAIAKHGVEHAGGKIWFETSDEGTTFYIELLMAD